MPDPPHPEPGSIAWMDLTVPNAEPVREFYQAVAGWTATPVDMGGYSDHTMCLPANGGAVAGVCHQRGVNAALPPVWMIYIAVADLDASMRRCRELGGKVLVEPKTGSQNRYCVIEDPAGAVCALMEPPKP